MPGFDEMYVNGAQLTLFEKGVSVLDRQDILHSGLFAQLVANKVSKGTISDWQHQYDSGVARSHWLRASTSTQQVPWPRTSSCLRTLVSQMLADAPYQRMVIAGLDQLNHPLNAKAMATLHAAVCKPAGGGKQQGLWLQVMMVRSPVDIQARSLILERTPISSGADWLKAPLPSQPAPAHLAIVTSRYQLRPDYASIRARVETAVGKWPEQLTVALSTAPDELDIGLPEPSTQLEPPTQP